jgi:uncharacterized repeat protein (TIGR02543 family)
VSDPTATITVNGTPATSGSPSSPISLNVGPNLIPVVITAQNGTFQTYTITVTRAGPTPPAPPTIVPHGGSITTTQTAGITAGLSGNQAIYYTITGGDSGTTPAVASAVYSSAFIVSPVPGTFTVEAMVFDPDTDLWSSPDAATFIVGVPPAAPTITPGDCSITTTQTVGIEADLSAGQTIYYGIINDTTLTGVTGNVYSGPFTVSPVPGTFSAIAWVYDSGTGLWSSPDVTTFNVGAAASPTIIQHGGNITTAQTVGIEADLSAGQTAYYVVIDDLTQSVNSYVYSGPFIVSPVPGVFKVDASVYDPGTGQWSNPDVATFDVSAAPAPPAAPAIVPHGGIITPTQTVGIEASLSAGQAIYYTVTGGDSGATPTVASAVYSGPFKVSPTPGVFTVEAKVYDPGTDLWSSPDAATFYVVGFGLTVTPPEITLTVGQQSSATATFTTSVYGSVYATTDVTGLAAWSSEDNQIATVNAGQIMGVTAGTTVVSAVYQDMSGAVPVTVIAPAPTCAVTYNGNGNTGGNVPADGHGYQPGATVTVLGNTGNLARTGYIFSGWNTAPDGSGTAYQAGGSFAITANTTLYAVWSIAPLCTVTYDGNGGSGAPPADSNSPYLPGATVTVLGNTGNLTRTGYLFSGWNTAPDGSGTAYQAGGSFAITANTTLYAVWTPIIPGGGGGGSSSGPTTNALLVPPPPVPSPPASPSAFIARWPGHVDLDQTYYIPSSVSGLVPATFTAPAPDQGKLAAAKANGLEERVYYFNEKYQKWVALTSYPRPDGSVLVVNDGGYNGVWTEMFAVQEPHFTDITGNWAEDVVNRMNGLALIEGYPVPGDPDSLDRTAGVDQTITRAEFATILARALGCLPPAEQKLYGALLPYGEEPDQVLADWTGVPDWARDFVAGMVYGGLVQGEAPHDFAGNAPITRIEAAVLVSKVLSKLPNYQPADLSQFADAAGVPDWARAAVASGVLNGYPNGTLLPNNSITRAESLVTILKLLRALGW